MRSNDPVERHAAAHTINGAALSTSSTSTLAQLKTRRALSARVRPLLVIKERSPYRAIQRLEFSCGAFI
jgi:hypothetical protein